MLTLVSHQSSVDLTDFIDILYFRSTLATHPTAPVLLLIEEVPLADLSSVAPDLPSVGDLSSVAPNLPPVGDLASVTPDLGDGWPPPGLLEPRGAWSVGGGGPHLAVVLTWVLNIAWSVMLTIMMMMT